MQKLAAGILLFTLLLPFGIKLSIVANYAMNLHYYQTVLCENKDKPELKCNGKCHLKKELTALEPKQETPAAPALPAISSLSIEVFELPNLLEVTPLISTALTPEELTYSSKTLLGFIAEQNEPPELIA